MPDIKLIDGKKISFGKTIDGFEIAKKAHKTPVDLKSLSQQWDKRIITPI